MIRKILITGATSGIGLAVAKYYLKKNFLVYCQGRNFCELDKFVQNNKLKKKYVKILLDFNHSFSPKKISKLEGLDKILISSGFVKNNLVKFFDEKIFDSILNVNLMFPLKLISYLYSNNKINNKAQIVFLSSLLGHVKLMPGTSAYATSKAGMIGAMKSFALEFSEKEISINAIAPGMVNTPLVKNAKYISKEQFKKDNERYLIGKKYLTINEIKNQIIFLLSSQSKRITGQTLVIDAGFSLK